MENRKSELLKVEILSFIFIKVNLCFLCSAEFASVAEIAVKSVVDTVVKDMEMQFGGDNLTLGLPLARLLPRVTQMGPAIVEEPTKNQFIQVIRNVPEVELFFTLLYSNMPFS